MIKNKRVLISGMAGSIGSELTRQLCINNKVFGLDISEKAFVLSESLKQDGKWVEARIGDIRDVDTVKDLFEDFKPQVVFHAAALKHVTPNERYPLEAIQTNAVGTYNILHEAKRWECLEKFVYISTDKVINSNSIMGATKRLGEIMVKNHGGIAVRFGNVMGSSGSLIPIWQDQVDNGKPITVTDERMTRYFMTIPQACELVIEAAEQGQGGEIFILDMKTPVNILELAKKVIKETGRDIGIKMTGIRLGETLNEKLMTAEEELIAKRVGKFFVIK